TAIQALEFDDIAPALAAHFSSVLLPTVGAFADEVDAERAVDGAVLGLRIAAAVSELIGFVSHARGLQPTHTLGPLVAALATAHGLGLTPEQSATAVALSVTGSLGLRANTGVRVKPMQSGFAAAAAVRAVELARCAPDHAVGESVIDGVFSLLAADIEKVQA